MVQVLKNEEKQGIEIYFDTKPIQEIINTLKEAKFRWHNVKKCWYAKENENTLEIANKINNGEKIENVSRGTETKTKENIYGIKVGDIFEMSWGYEQTNVDFFRVKELRGKTQVVLQEVRLKLVEETGISGMSADRKYDINNYKICDNSVHIKDNEKGAIKTVKQLKNGHIYINMCSYANAYIYKGETVYESWYY